MEEAFKAAFIVLLTGPIAAPGYHFRWEIESVGMRWGEKALAAIQEPQ